jgi:ElaB/YqjD/DUF883 family membrane-anchored ribosome-binding protein
MLLQISERELAMQTQNDVAQENRHVLEAQLDAIKHEVSKLLDRVTATSEPPRLKTLVRKAAHMIEAHPMAAVATALGLGYFLVRAGRR